MGITFLFICTGITPSVAVDTVKKSSMSISNGKTLYVGGTGEGNYTKIQSAINDTSDGDTVFVYAYSSPYNENVIIDKSINLIGEDRNTTILDGNHEGNVIYIQANEVLIHGFTIKNCKSPGTPWRYCTIKIINSDNVVIKNNKISVGDIEYNNNVAGIFLQGSSNNLIQDNIIYDGVWRVCVGIEIQENCTSNNITGNEISDSNYGIRLNSRYNTIFGNNIHQTIWGIHLQTYAARNNIVNNIISANRGPGIILYADDNIVTENIITNNGVGGEFDCGIEVGGSNNIISYNIISDNNPTGIYIWDTDCSITNNHISNNHQIGIYMLYSQGCIITKNNLIDNGNYNACFDTILIYSFSNRWRRNYWSDKQGILTYRIKGFIYLGGLYPLRVPWMTFDVLPALKPYDIEGVM